MKRLTSFFLVSLSSFFVFSSPAEAAENIYFFHSQTCPHCHEEIKFLKDLQSRDGEVAIKDYEVIGNADNAKLLQKVAKILDTSVRGVPFTVVGDTPIVGFMSPETTGRQIEKALALLREGSLRDSLVEVVDREPDGLFTTAETPTEVTPQEASDLAAAEGALIPKMIDLPLFGAIDTKHVSLPVLTFMIALLDGFNPCAMWVLIFLISLLLGMENRRRMWLLGSTFILASGVVYFLFLSAWLNTFLFLGFQYWIQITIGIIALGTGGYYLYDAATNKDGACQISHQGSRQKTLKKLKALVYDQNLFLALGGIILLAFAVNVIEALCSAGLPAVYTQILTFSDLQTWQYYGYLLFYILIFMLDDLIVFFLAMTTLKFVAINTKYARISHLIGGLVMLLLGILLVFAPEKLIFG